MVAETVAPDREDFIAEPPEPDASASYDDGYSHNPDGSVRLKKDGSPMRKRGRAIGWRKGDGSTTGPRTRGSLEAQIGGMLWTINIPLQLVPVLQKDALDAIEITALAKAIDKECQNNARFRKYVESALKVQGATSLVSVVGLIAARRVVRHEIIDIPDSMGGVTGVDDTIGSLIAMVSGQGIVPIKRQEESS